MFRIHIVIEYYINIINQFWFEAAQTIQRFSLFLFVLNCDYIEEAMVGFFNVVVNSYCPFRLTIPKIVAFTEKMWRTWNVFHFTLQIFSKCFSIRKIFNETHGNAWTSTCKVIVNRSLKGRGARASFMAHSYTYIHTYKVIVKCVSSK
jgi:hypothetical protein